MTEVHDTNSTSADAETVMPGQSRDSHPLSTSHAPLGDEISHLKNVEGAVHHLPVELPRVVIVGAGFGGLRAARALRNAPVRYSGIRLGTPRNVEGTAHNLPVEMPRVVIVGAGFGGLGAVRALRNAHVQVTVIDRQNHHLFQPLLYWVATAGLSPADICSPIRGILRNQKNAEVFMDEVTGVDTRGQQVLMGDRSVLYDYLVLATGVHDNYFGHPEWEHYAPGLKSIVDAISIRRKVLLAFEAAEIETDPEKIKALLTFVLVGAGPTGVEMAGAIAELAHKALASDFRHIDTLMTRIVLIEAGPRILAAFPESLDSEDATEIGFDGCGSSHWYASYRCGRTRGYS